MKSRALNFPNPSRSYDETGHGVRFWGYDQTFEVSFFVEDGALSKVHPDTTVNEAGFLNTFDVNRVSIAIRFARWQAISIPSVEKRHTFSHTL
jgi:hypothetical protein